MIDDQLIDVLYEAAGAVKAALGTLDDWGPAGTKVGQYRSDLVADAAAIEVLAGAGLGVLSEETGAHHPDRPLQAVLDPVDGSTNASRRLPWYATSLCVLDAEGPRAAVVVNQATGERFDALRGGGARCDGGPMAPTTCKDLGDAVIGVAGWPARYFGWRQMRALGAAALDLCAVAAGRLDAYIDCSMGAHGPWDYLGGLLVCREAGALVVDAAGRELVVRGFTDRRIPVAAATEALLTQAVEARAAVA
ncbi:MAG: inositol monophosphatase [Actinomycetota bacterium]|nr:inositol monophosphatase [Actinomycetota bacterium]